MHKELHTVVAYVTAKPNVNKVAIFTNATIVPREHQWESLKNDKVRLFITDYDELSRNIRPLVEALNERGISYVSEKANGWTDWLHTNVTISVNHGLRELAKLAEVAVRNSPLEPVIPKALEPDREVTWKRLAARLSRGLIEKIAKMAEEGKAPVVKLLPGFEDKEGKLVEVSRRAKKIPMEPKPGFTKAWRVEYTGAVKSLYLEIEGQWGKVRAKVGQVDWAATAEANGLAA
jgi:hypothetical protein